METKATPRPHALLSPSSADRWLHCPPSARLNADKTESSDFADEGTVAHAVCAKLLREAMGLPTAEEDAELGSERGRKWYNPLMREHADKYAAYVLARLAEAYRVSTDAVLRIEQRVSVDLGADTEQELFGTADAIIAAGDVIEIIDFKYGQGVAVNANNNAQLMLYALGALALFESRPVRRVRMTIFQPRRSNYSSCELTAAFLRAWLTHHVRPVALLAQQGEGLREPGHWCRFCGVAGTCPAMAWCAKLYADDSTEPDHSPAALTPEGIGSLLPALDVLENWTKAVRDHAASLIMDGTPVPGFKIVAGRCVRRLRDPEAVADALSRAGYAEADIFRPRELRTLTDLESLVGRKRFGQLCAGQIDRPQGKPTLVSDDDPRPAWNADSDFDELNL